MKAEKALKSILAFGLPLPFFFIVAVVLSFSSHSITVVYLHLAVFALVAFVICPLRLDGEF